jgi:TP901 family phage tail tape measure protein
MALDVGSLTASLSLDMGKFDANMARAKSSLGSFGSKADKVGAGFTKAGQGMKKTSMLVGAGLVGVLKASGDFESGMNRVKALTGETGEQFNKLEAQAKKLGSTTMFSATQASEGMQFLAMAGFETNEIMEAMPGTLALAAAGQLDLARAADISSNVLSGFALDAGEATRVADLLAKTASTANTDVSQLGEAMKYVAPVAAALGVSVEETAASIGILGNAGIQGSMAGTTLRGAMMRMIKPSNEAAGALNRLGINAMDSSGEFIGLNAMVKQFGESAYTQADLVTIFGQRAGPGMSVLLAEGSDALEEYTAELENAGGTAQSIADVQMEGFNGQLLKLKSAAEGLAIAIGQSGLLESFTKLAEKLTALASSLGKTNPAILKMVTGVALLVALGAPLLIFAGKTLTAMATISTAMLGTTVSLAALTAAFGPLLLGVAVFYAVGKGLDKMTKYVPDVDALTEALQELGETGNTTGRLGDIVGDGFEGVPRLLDEAAYAGGRLDKAFVDLAGAVEFAIPGLDEIHTTGERATMQFLELGDALLTLSGQGSGGVDALGAALDGLVEQTDGSAQAIHSMLLLMPQMDEVLKGTGLTMEQFSAAVADGTSASDVFTGGLADTQAAADQLSGKIDAGSIAAEQFTEQINGASDVMPGLTSDMQEMSQEAAEVEAGLTGVTEAFDYMTGRFISEQEALMAMAESMGALAEVGADVAGGLNVSTEAGRENMGMMFDLVESAHAVRTAQIEAGTAVGAANTAFDEQIVSIRNAMIQMGFTTEAVDGLLASINLVPSEVPIEVTASAIPQVIRDIEGISDLAPVVTVRVHTVHTSSGLINGGKGNVAGNIAAPFFGAGGDATMGSPIIVGDRGPEIFIPQTNGTVIPNDEVIRGMGGGSGGGGSSVAMREGAGTSNTYNVTVPLTQTQMTPEELRRTMRQIELVHG